MGACATVDEAQRRLQSEWGMTEVQAMCALDLQVMRFTEQWRRRIADERDELVQRIAELTA